MKEIADREEAILEGKKSSIIYLREVSKKDGKTRTISGYIDLNDRLRKEEFGKYFRGEEKLVPNKNDLSYYCFESQISKSNASDTFKVEIDDSGLGLIFTHKLDRKSINVNPDVVEPGDNTKRYDIIDPDYEQVVVWDHESRRAQKN
mmetsp:Transcript_78738/g.170177  ORF Transcript_78738/g.170177 Transcript_78738/m.170177 type:complete len:147 (+) Transcript_78738:299-739(+)|eukprot:CAMPEP_0116956058 /NCGR_PEP_ID=MMETSP0467-20121206/43067_1 /TAXON_ID=283647 /ORGANISM="Mesodinium pulex, Strain SPMC105" /LENGTH=146 /DNA_ID=CAMNT_0004642379 /DNA_START=299 /DNA_END=739 /DNA_ORIENTATION=+